MNRSLLLTLGLALALTGVAACGGSEETAATTTQASTTTETSGDTTTTETPAPEPAPAPALAPAADTTPAPAPAPAPAADTTPPTVTSLQTGTGAAVAASGTEVPVDSTFLLTFDAAMKADTVTSTTVTLTCLVGDVTGDAEPTVAATEGNIAFTITPKTALPKSATCTLTATTGVQDAAGNALAAAAAFAFTTPAGTDGGADGDTTAPTVTLKTASGSAVATSGSIVPTSATFVATFSEPMNPLTVTKESVSLLCGIVAIDADVTKVDKVGDDGIADNEWTVVPTSKAGLPAAATDCVLTFSTANADVAGNGLTATTFTFETCGTSDDFSNANSLGVCWTAAADNTGKIATSNADGVETFTIAKDVATAGLQIGFTKSLTDTNLTVTATLAGLSGLVTAAGETGAADSASVQLVGTGGAGKTAFCGVMGSGGAGLKVVFFVGTPGADNPPASDTIGSGSGLGAGETLALLLTKTGSDFDCAYSFGGAAPVTVGGTKTLDIGATYTGGLGFSNVAGDDPLSALVTSVEFVAGGAL